jgi:hypothetical protein
MNRSVASLTVTLLVTAAVAGAQPTSAPATSLSATIATGQPSPADKAAANQAPLPTLQVINNNDRPVSVLVFMEDDGSYIWGKAAGRGKTEVFEFPAAVVRRPMTVAVFDNVDYTAFRSKPFTLNAGQQAVLVVQDDLPRSQLTVK